MILLPIVQCLGVIAVCGAVVVAAPLAQRFTTPQPMPRCEPGKWPEFNYGFAALRLDLGADMGGRSSASTPLPPLAIPTN